MDQSTGGREMKLLFASLIAIAGFSLMIGSMIHGNIPGMLGALGLMLWAYWLVRPEENK